jgi:hypothetical protein
VELEVDYPVRPRARYGWGTPAHPRLEAMVAAGVERYRSVLQRFLLHRDALGTITADSPQSVEEPYWTNGFIPGLDGVALYSFVADQRPASYVEVGSGNSTKFVRRAVRDHGLSTYVLSIDPFPRAEIDSICDEVLRLPVEEVDLGLFDRLGDGDVLFVDNSHRAFQNSDATVMLTEVIPSLPAGVLVGIHDIFLPEDYPPQWADRYYSEQYLLAAWLLGGGGGCEIVLPSHYIRSVPELDRLCDPIWSSPALSNVERHGGAFWFRTG